MKTRDLLTKRQIQVLRLIATGRTSSDVADDLGIKPRTVDGCLASIYVRLKVNNRLVAINAAKEMGLL